MTPEWTMEKPDKGSLLSAADDWDEMLDEVAMKWQAAEIEIGLAVGKPSSGSSAPGERIESFQSELFLSHPVM